MGDIDRSEEKSLLVHRGRPSLAQGCLHSAHTHRPTLSHTDTNTTQGQRPWYCVSTVHLLLHLKQHILYSQCAAGSSPGPDGLYCMSLPLLSPHFLSFYYLSLQK